jgi:hypothetical protein
MNKLHAPPSTGECCFEHFLATIPFWLMDNLRFAACISANFGAPIIREMAGREEKLGRNSRDFQSIDACANSSRVATPG